MASDISSNQSVGSPADQKYIIVFDPKRSEQVEILLDADGNMPLSFIECRFPGAYYLQYKNKETERYRAVMFDKEKSAFLPPSDGWCDRIYNLVFKGRSRPTSPMDVDSQPFTETEGLLPSLEAIKPFLYHTKETIDGRQLLSCVTLLSDNYFSTYRHGPHKSLNLGDKVMVYSDYDSSSYVTQIKYIHEMQDFMLLKSFDQIKDVPTICEKKHSDGLIKIIGRGNKDNITCTSVGSIFREMFFQDSGPFILGRMQTAMGDSGAPVFCKDGLFAMNVGLMELEDGSHSDAYNHAANFASTNCMVPVLILMSYVRLIERKRKAKFSDSDLSPKLRLGDTIVS